MTDDRRLLLHLRDDIPTILHPGCWAGFGGGVEDGEDLEDAMRREIREETGVRVGDVDVLGDYVDEVGEGGAGDLVTVFVTRGGIDLDDIDLQEGAGVGVHSLAEVGQLRVTPFVSRVIHEHLARELGVTRS